MTKKYILYAALVVILLFITNILVYFVYPDVSALKNKNPTKTAFMEYQEKKWADEGIKKKIIQKWVPFKNISPYLVKAVIIAEDDKFWSHEGFDFDAMQDALEKDLKKRKLKAGGSTISQQLAKNLYLSPSKNPIRKIKEAILTWRLEHTLSKKRIVELYLNVAQWGDNIFGIQAASLHYYGKPASELSAEEASRLAIVLPSPARYNPVGDSKYIRNQSARIYKIMVHRGIVVSEFEEVMKAPEEKIEEVKPEALAVEVNTSGPVLPDEKEQPKNTEAESNQATDNTNPDQSPAPEINGQTEKAPDQLKELQNKDID